MERNIFVNEVLYCNDEEQLYRVLWISPGQEYGYWIPVDGRMNGILVKFDCKKVVGGLADGIITSVDDPITFRDINMTAEAMKQRDEWWRILKPVLESEPDIYERKRRGELLAEAAEKNGKSKTNLYRYIIKYWKRGKTPNVPGISISAIMRMILFWTGNHRVWSLPCLTLKCRQKSIPP